MTTRLIFVYNANAGLVAGALDTVHKTLSPDTYPCNLCALTHGAFVMRPEWRRWLKQLPFAADFYHRSDFRLAYPGLANEPLPLVGIESSAGFSKLLDADALARISEVSELVSALQAQLASAVPQIGVANDRYS